MAESMTFSRLSAIATLAFKGDVEAVVKLLAVRQDYSDNRKFKAAAFATEAMGDKKMTLGEAQLIGLTKSGEQPVTPDWLGQALIELAREKNANSHS